MGDKVPHWLDELLVYGAWLAKTIPGLQRPYCNVKDPDGESINPRLLLSVQNLASLAVPRTKIARCGKVAIELWNAMVHEPAGDFTSERLLCQVRAFAALLLHAAWQAESESGGSSEHAQLVAESLCKTASFCLANAMQDLAETLVEKAALYELGVAHTFNFLYLRIHLSFLDKRLDTAKFWLSKLEDQVQYPSMDQTERLGRLMLDIGINCRKTNDLGEAIFWLNKADHTRCFDHAASSGWTGGLLWELVRARLESGNELGEQQHRADNSIDILIERLERTGIAASTVSLLRLELASSRASPTHEEVSKAILGCVAAKAFGPDTIEALLERVAGLNSRDPSLAIYALRTFLLTPNTELTRPEIDWEAHQNNPDITWLGANTNNAHPWHENEFTGTIILSFLHVVIRSEGDNCRAYCIIDDLLLCLERDHPHLFLGSDHTQACHALIWRAIQKAEDQNGAISWSRIALRPLFKFAGDRNTTIFQGRLTRGLMDSLREYYPNLPRMQAQIALVLEAASLLNMFDKRRLAVALFNSGVDAYQVCEDDASRMACDGAMMLACDLDDGGALGRLFTTRIHLMD